MSGEPQDLGSAPAISVEGHQDGGIQVVCRSSGWYPQPKAQWRDLQGQLLPSASENISPEANGLFQAEIAIVITEESNQKVSCCVRNPRLNQERESAISIAVEEQDLAAEPVHGSVAAESVEQHAQNVMDSLQQAKLAVQMDMRDSYLWCE
ncbi:hypothetical protein KIL84_004785 [Mauremys mutica]|uniref:Ig-like domain-containing protein n=1 Tax=Mauremys mutica TaxID=74926 RepID=A0A9D3XQ31_9SAUR|nr:hypothetical protein KIL84_004785 [Mauremys mutica]